MSETLGKIEKPEAADFRLCRKLIFVPLVLLPPSNDTELTSLIQQYWDDATEQVNKLAGTFDGIKKIFHELVPAGESGLAAIAHISAGSQDLVKTIAECGATLEETEDPETLIEFLDWGRCLSLRLESPIVFNEVYKNYAQAQQKRDEAISKKIDESLKNDELGLVLLREEHRAQFPSDIQVLYVSPPSLDAIMRYMRDKFGKSPQEADNPADKTKE